MEGAPELSFHATPEEAVTGASFVQECVPERLPIKHEIYARMEPALLPEAVVATSASGLLLRDMQEGWADPGRLILGHPFNPPHLIPLVEIVLGKATDRAAAEWAHGFYGHIGKHAIYVNKEVPELICS